MSEPKIQTPAELINPASQAYVSQMITAAVREVFTQMAPVLESIALTPAKLREASKPYIDPAKVAREAREKAMMREDLELAARQKAEFQARCSHKDANGRWSVSTVHNYPDRQTRGVCVRCHRFFQPRHWEIGAPDAQNPRGKPVLVKEDSDYARMMADIAETAQTV